MAVKMAVLPVGTRDAYGPVTRAYYQFRPWANVDERDAEAFAKITFSSGCACNGTAKTGPLYGTEEQIKSGAVRPAWKGKLT